MKEGISLAYECKNKPSFQMDAGITNERISLAYEWNNKRSFQMDARISQTS